MNIIKGRHLGFCKGVERAVNMAVAAAEKFGKVLTYGELIHNSTMIEELKKKGVFPIADERSVNAGDAVVIRTHGVPEETYEKLKEKGANIIDATCPFVKNIHDKVAEYEAKGYRIIIIGYKDHPEVRGILGWCKDASVVKSEEEIDLSAGDKFYVVVQTTFDWDTYRKIASYIEISAKNSCKLVVLFNSICYTTKERQGDAASVSKASDKVVVVGDKNSSNTMRLKGIAESFGKPTFLIENANDIASVDIKNTANVGILAGASTPKELITEVLERMATTENNINVNEEKELTFKELLESGQFAPKSLRPGIKLKVIVNSADALGITVSLTQAFGKNDGGFIAADEVEIEGDYNPENYKAGDELDVVVIEKSAKSPAPLINLSKKAFDAIKIDDEKVKGILAGEIFDMKVTQAVKGGLLGKIGSYTIFIPASQIRMGFVKNLEEYVGKTLKLKALPPKEEAAVSAADGETVQEAPKKRRDNKRIVASARLVIEEEKAAKEDEFWSNIDINMIVEGKVKRFTQFGAFVSVYGYDCLAHISDIAWNKIKEPGDVLELGKTYKFVILKADRETGKVSLGYKQLQKKPYELAAEKYPVGTVIHGVVGRVQSFGAFIEIEPGIDGLVHVSQIGHSWIKDATQALKIGQEVDAVVTQFDGNKITLSMKDLLPEPEVSETETADAAEAAEKPSRADRFKKRAEGAETVERKPRRAKKDDGEEGQHEYVSNQGGATMADLFKKLNIDNLDQE